jgi:hypothetical protein
MADIAITIDASGKAAAGKNVLMGHLDKLESKAHKVQAAFAKLDMTAVKRAVKDMEKVTSKDKAVAIKAELKATRLKTDLKEIASRVKALVGTNPIKIPVFLKLHASARTKLMAEIKSKLGDLGKIHDLDTAGIGRQMEKEMINAITTGLKKGPHPGAKTGRPWLEPGIYPDPKDIDAVPKETEISKHMEAAKSEMLDQYGGVAHINKKWADKNRAEIEREIAKVEPKMSGVAKDGAENIARGTKQFLADSNKRMEKKFEEAGQSIETAIPTKTMDTAEVLPPDIQTELDKARDVNKQMTDIRAEASKVATEQGKVAKKKMLGDPKYVDEIAQAQDRLKTAQGRLLKEGKAYMPQYRKEVTKANAAVANFNKRLKNTGKITDKTSKRTQFFNSKFAKFSIIMSGIAATLFVWQELQQLIRGVLGIGTKYLGLLDEMQAAHQLNAATAQDFGKAVKSAMGKGIDTKTIQDAYSELINRGLSATEATKKLSLTLDLAKNPMIDIADASKIAARGYTGLQQQILRANRSIESSVTSVWKRIKGVITVSIASWFEKREPEFLKHLDRLQAWVNANQRNIESFLDATLGLVQAIGYSLSIILPNLASLVGLLHKIPFEGMRKLWELFNATKLQAPEGFTWEQWERFDAKAKAEGWTTLEIQIGLATHKLETYTKRLSELDSQINAMPTKSIFKRFAEEEIDLEDIVAGKANTKGLQNLSKEADVFRNKIKLLNVVIDALNKKLEKPAPIIGLAERLKQWEAYFGKVGRMSGLHKNLLTENILESVQKAREVVGNVPALQLKAKLLFELDKRELGPEMRAHLDYFKTVGKIPVRIEGGQEVEKWYATSVSWMKKEIELNRHLETSEKRILAARKLRALWAQKEKPKLEAHEYVYEETGDMSDYLKQRKVSAAASEYLKALEQEGINAAKAAGKYMLDIAKIEEDAYAKRHEMHKNYWEATGVITEDHVTDDLKILDNYKKAWLQIYPEMNKEIEAWYEHQEQVLMDKLTQPTLDAYRNMYDEIGMMSEEHYMLEEGRVDRRVEYLKTLLGAENELVKAYEKRLKLELEIQKLESGTWQGWDDDSMTRGIEAASKRLQILKDDWMNVAKGVSEAWEQGAVDMEAAFKEGFFAVMSFEFENLEDIAIGVLKSIQKMLNEILWALARAAILRGIGDWFGGSTTSLQHGGWITEPVVGVGVRSGSTYTIAEKAPEYVSPEKQVGGAAGPGGSLTINVPVAVEGGGDTTNLESRLRVEIEETVKDIVREEMR